MPEVQHPILQQWRSCRDPDDFTVAVEFECGGCCRKAYNATIADVLDGVLILVAGECDPIVVKVICPRECEEKEYAQIVIIPLDKISSVEIAEKKHHHCDRE